MSQFEQQLDDKYGTTAADKMDEGDSTTNHETKDHHDNKHNMSLDSSFLIESRGEERIQFVHNYYGYIAFIAGLLNGLMLFFYEIMVYTQIDKTTFSLYYSEFIGFYIFFIFYHLKEAIHQKQKYGTFWSYDRLSFLERYEQLPLKHYQSHRIEAPIQQNQEKRLYRINRYNIFAVLMITGVQLFSTFLRIAVIQAETLADINFSLIANIIALCPFVVAVLFYFIFKESLDKVYILGIGLLLICVLMTSLSSTSSTSDTYLLPVWVPIVLAVIQVIMNAFACVITRYVVMHTNLTVQQIMADSFFIQGTVFLIFYMFCDYPYVAGIFWTIAGISILGFVGSYLLYEAVTYGKAAPAQALNNTSTLFDLLLEIIFLNKVPSVTQLVAFTIGVVGSFLIAFESRVEARAGR